MADHGGILVNSQLIKSFHRRTYSTDSPIPARSPPDAKRNDFICSVYNKKPDRGYLSGYVHKMGVEPTRLLRHIDLNDARLPFRHMCINRGIFCSPGGDRTHTPCGYWILNPARLPFRHEAISSGEGSDSVAVSTHNLTFGNFCPNDFPRSIHKACYIFRFHKPWKMIKLKSKMVLVVSTVGTTFGDLVLGQNTSLLGGVVE